GRAPRPLAPLPSGVAPGRSRLRHDERSRDCVGGGRGSSPQGSEHSVTHSGSPVWLPSPALQSHLNRAATGNPDYDWLSYVRALHLPAALERTLVLGCGSGVLERALIRKD